MIPRSQSAASAGSLGSPVFRVEGLFPRHFLGVWVSLQDTRTREACELRLPVHPVYLCSVFRVEG